MGGVDDGHSSQREPPLRIVHAVCSDQFAGVERYVIAVGGALRDRGHSVTILGGDPTAVRDNLAGGDIATAPAARVSDLVLALIKHARHSDVVHVHMTAAEIAAVVASISVRAPVVTTRHFAARRGSSVAGRLAAPVIRRRMKAELAISEFVASAITEPSEVILNAVPDAEEIDPTAHVVLMAQRLEQEKHTAEALTAWEISGLGRVGWQLWIAGDGAERSQLEQRLADRRDPSIRLLGFRRDLAELRRSSGIFLATAPAEPFGLSVAEAMAAGLPVVAARGGGHLETVGSIRPDLLYEPGDPASCASTLRRLAHDERERRVAGRELRSFQQRVLGLDRHVDQLVEVYRRVIPRGDRAAGSVRATAT